MRYRNLLVHLDATPACERRLDVAAGLARRFEAKLTAVYAIADARPRGAAAGTGGDGTPQPTDRLARAFRERCAAAGIASEWHAAIATNDVRVNRTVVGSARHFDMAILGQFDPGAADGVRADLVEETVLMSGRPVLVVPHAGAFAETGRRVMVAWTPTREAVRAVNDALPLLAAADSVALVTLDPAAEPKRRLGGPVADMVGHLSIHGIRATVERVAYDRDAIDAADRLLSHVADESIDLLVMGAFTDREGRSRSRETLTERMLAHMTVPVLMAH